MNLLIGAATIGLILALLGLGVFISYRIYHLLDLTADGSFGVGVAVAAALLVRGVPAARGHRHRHRWPASLAGGITGFLHTRFQVNALLAGVLTSTALYSVSLFVMGSGNLSLASRRQPGHLGPSGSGSGSSGLPATPHAARHRRAAAAASPTLAAHGPAGRSAGRSR